MSFKRLVISLFPLISVSCFIIFISHIPANKLPEIGFWQWDKFAHIFEYFVYSSIVLFFICGIKPKISKQSKIIILILVSIVFGASDEIHQMFVPGRTCDIFDLMADSVGALITVFLFKHLVKMFNSIYTMIDEY